jgi:hypothetical protein
VLIEPHDVAGGLVSGDAHAFAQQGERGLALLMAEIGQADSVAHQPGMNVRPLPPRFVIYRETGDLALFRAKRSNARPRRFQQGRERYPGLLDSKEPRLDPAAGGDPAEGVGKTRFGPVEHRLEPRGQIERPQRRRWGPLTQTELRRFSCHAHPS